MEPFDVSDCCPPPPSAPGYKPHPNAKPKTADQIVKIVISYLDTAFTRAKDQFHSDCISQQVCEAIARCNPTFFDEGDPDSD